jgi:RNA polymerase sigma factor (sigma-70 family)
MLKTVKLNLDPKGLIEVEAVEEYYAVWRREFFSFASKYSLDRDEIADVYQDAMIVMIENINRGKLTELTSSLKTYLFAIGKNLIRNRLRSNQKTHTDDSLEKLDSETEHYAFMPEDEADLKGDMMSDLLSAIEHLGEKCKEILYYYYYQKLSIRAIGEKLGYANENTVKANKSRCLKTLREKINKKEA